MKLFVVLVLAFIAFNSISAVPVDGIPLSRPDPSGGLNACGITAVQVSALAPLLNKLGLSKTVNGVKQLVVALIRSVGNTLDSPGVNGPQGITEPVINLVNGLLRIYVDLSSLLIAKIRDTQVQCMLYTLLPFP